MKNYFDETFFRLSTTGNFASIRILIVIKVMNIQFLDKLIKKYNYVVKSEWVFCFDFATEIV